MGSGDEQAIRQLDQQWVDAYLRRDAAALGRILADDWVQTNPDGSVGDKAQELADLGSGAIAFEAFETEDVRVRFFGEVALADGRAVVKGIFKGQDASGRYRFLDVYVKRGDQWQAVATMVTRTVG